MKTYAYNEVTFMQFVWLNYGVQVSVGLLALPQVLALHAGTDGWVALILGWITATAASLFIVQAMKKYPDGTVLDLLTRYAGKWAGKTAAVLLGLYFLYYGYTGIVRTVLYTKVWLLPQTPAPLIMMLLLIPTYMLARNGLRILGRYAELVFFLSLWIPFAYLLPLKDAHWLHLLPVLKEGWKPVLSAYQATFLSFTGFGGTYILYPFLLHKEKASIAVVVSNTLTMLTFLFVTIVCFVYFSPDRMAAYNEPLVNVLKTIEFKFIERIEVLFIAFYLFIFSLAWIPMMNMSAFCTSWLFGKQDHRIPLRLLWLLIAAGTWFFMPTFNQNDRMEKMLTRLGLGVEYAFPVCLLVYLWLHDLYRRRKPG